MTLSTPHHNHSADECIHSLHEVPTHDEQVRASEAFSKNILVTAHMAHLHDAYILEMATHPVNVLPPTPTSPSSLCLEGFKAVRLNELKEGKVHRRRVLHGTFCVRSLNMHAVANILEDEGGNAINIWIRNAVPRNCSTAQVQRLYPQGSRVAVREPYLTRSPSGVLVVLVEDPADLIFLWVPEVQDIDSESHTSNGMEVVDKHKETNDRTEVSKSEEGSEQHEEGSEMQKDTPIFDGMKEAQDVSNGKAIDAKKEQQQREDGSEMQNELKGTQSRDFALFNSKQLSTELDDAGLLPSEENDKPLQGGEGSEEERAAAEKKAEDDGETEIKQAIMNEKEENNATQKLEDIGMDVVPAIGSIDGIWNNGTPECSYEENRLEEAIQETQKDDTQKLEGVGKEAEPLIDNTNGISSGGSESSYEENRREEVVQEAQKVVEEPDPYSSMSAAALRLQGNRLFAKGDLALAAELYSRSIQKARGEDDEEEEKVVGETGVVVNGVVMGLSNRAEVWLRMGKYDEALEDAERALEEKGGHLKSLFRKGRALMGLQKYGEALKLLKEVQERASNDTDVKAAVLQCKAGLEEKKPKPGKKKRAAAQKQQQKLPS